MNLEQMMAQMTDQLKAEMNQANSAIYQSLVEDKAAITNKLPENIFVNYFLPFFLNERNDNPNWLIEWIGIAGSSASEMNIVHDITREHLFFVPAVFNSDQIRIDPTDGTSYKNIFARYDLINNNIPQQGIRFLVNELGKKLNNIGVNGVNQTELNFHNQWRYILQRYNRLPQQNQQAFADSTGTNISDLMSF